MTKNLFFFLLFISGNSVAQIRQFYNQSINSTILLYKKDSTGQLVSHGTAFTLYNYDTINNGLQLITCEHLTHHDTLIAVIPADDSIKKILLEEKKSKIVYNIGNGNVITQFDGNNFLFMIPLKLGFNLFKHKYLDLAVIFCDLPSKLKDDKNQMIALTNLKALSKSYMSSNEDVFPGQEVIFVGFPYGIGTKYGFQGSSLYGDHKSNPLLRKGIVSWCSENSDMFLVDGFSFSGNSGSPIFSIPNLGYEGKFVGMVIGHLSDSYPVNNIYIDTLKNQLVQNVSAIVINDGLAQCIPSSLIYEFASVAIKRRNETVSELKNSGKKK
jgi:hypothetical protein